MVFTNMKTSFLFLFIIPVIIACKSRNNCEDFRTGKFTYQVLDTEWVVERNDSLQTEYCEELGVNMELNISWLNKCTYVLKFKRFLQNDAGFELDNTHIVHSTITRSGKDYYITESQIAGSIRNSYEFTRTE